MRDVISMDSIPDDILFRNAGKSGLIRCTLCNQYFKEVDSACSCKAEKQADYYYCEDMAA